MRKVGDQRYLVQEWKNGSECDLTEKPRTVEVQVNIIFYSCKKKLGRTKSHSHSFYSFIVINKVKIELRVL